MEGYSLVYVAIGIFFSSLVVGQDPCLETNHRNISHFGKRYSSLNDTCPYTDNRLQTGWYYAGIDAIVTSPPAHCSCGYTWPVWMDGINPPQRTTSPTTSVSNVTTTGISPPHTTEQPIINLPNVTIMVPATSITDSGFSMAMNTTYTTKQTGVDIIISLTNGTQIRNLTTNATRFQYDVMRLQPSTNYIVEVLFYANGANYSLGVARVTTAKQHRKASAHIKVDFGTLRSYILNIIVTYSSGSESTGSYGQVLNPDKTELHRFDINDTITRISIPNLSHGSNYTIVIYTEEKDTNVKLDSVWVFTPPDIITYHNKGQASFRCEFVPSIDDKPVRVRWIIKRDGRGEFVISKDGTQRSQVLLSLTDSDLVQNHIYLPFQIACAVRERKEDEHLDNVYSPSSSYYFAGIEVLTPNIVMYRDETAVVKVSPTVPSSCQNSNEGKDCNLELSVLVPSRNRCSGLSTRQCLVTIPGEKGVTGEIEIQASEDGQYGIMNEETYTLILRITKLQNSIWDNYSIQISVRVLPENETYWRGKTCESLNDPHMFTFDGRAFEHHENTNDEFVLYKHSEYNVKIHHKLERCNNDAMCNCGVAVQAGRDIYVVSTCNNMLEIGFKQCDDGVILVKQESDTQYSIYLPYGTYVKARVDNTPYQDSAGSMIVSISVFPSVHDLHGRSNGLCGTLDNNPDNDLGTHETDRIDFINKWSVSATESIFGTMSVSGSPWKSPVCMCSLENAHISETVECVHATDLACTKGRRVGKQICTAANKRPIGSTKDNNIPTLQLGTTIGSNLSTSPHIPSVTSHVTTAKTNSITRGPTTTTKSSTGQVTKQRRWTEAKARDFCTGYMDKSHVYRLCSHVPFSDTEKAVKTCVLDVMITQTTHWQRISRTAMQESCISEIGRNKTVREDKESPAPSHAPTFGSTITPVLHSSAHNNVHSNQSITTSTPIDVNSISSINELVKAIESIACPNECNDQGNCNNGTCECYEGYGGDDCFIDIGKPPSLSTIMHGNTCDESEASCTHVSIYGGLFASKTVSCHITTFQMYADIEGKQDMDAYVLHGQAQSLVQIICPLAPTRRKRSFTTQDHHVKIVTCYRVSVSNDGIHHSDSLNMCVFNSKCQTLKNDTNGLLTAELKPNYCFIDRECIPKGTLHEEQICDPYRTLYQWSNQESKLVTMVTEYITTDGPVKHPIPDHTKNTPWKWPVIVAILTICVATFIVVVVICVRKQRARVQGKVDTHDGYKEDKPAVDNEHLDEVYDHINPSDVADEVSQSTSRSHHFNYASAEYESVSVDYMKLNRSGTNKSEYDSLHQGEIIHLQNIPPLPARTNTMQRTDPYTKLTQVGRDDKEYAKLKVDRNQDDYYLSPLQSNNQKTEPRLTYMSCKAEDVQEGYELPIPQADGNINRKSPW